MSEYHEAEVGSVWVENSLRLKYKIVHRTSEWVTLVRLAHDAVPFNVYVTDFRIKYEGVEILEESK